MGTITIFEKRCKGCGLCVEACPKKIIILSERMNHQGYYVAELTDADGKCNGCAFCAELCPDVAIEVWR